MKQTIGPMLCKLNTAQATIPELAERKAAEEAEKRRAAEAAAKAAAEREAAARRQREEAAARKAAEEAQRKQKAEAVARAESARKQQSKPEKAKASGWKEKGKSAGTTVLAFAGMAILLVAGFALLFGLDTGLTYVADHIPFLWEPATCTEPAVNKLTKNTRGEPAGHQFDPVCTICGERHMSYQFVEKDHFSDPGTCLDESVCSACGESSHLGHVWTGWLNDADTIDYCINCGMLDIYNDFDWKLSEDTVALAGRDTRYYASAKNTPLIRSLTLQFSASVSGPWTVYVRTTEGVWTAIGQIEAGTGDDLYTLSLSQPLAINAVTAILVDNAMTEYTEYSVDLQVRSARADDSIAAAAVAADG